jgi:hypothetical protein
MRTKEDNTSSVTSFIWRSLNWKICSTPSVYNVNDWRQR